VRERESEHAHVICERLLSTLSAGRNTQLELVACRVARIRLEDVRVPNRVARPIIVLRNELKKNNMRSGLSAYL
jgi:hypothetical protein